MKDILKQRLRINRANPSTRNLVAENTLHPHDFIAPIFITHGKGLKEEIISMPGYYRYSLDMIDDELNQLASVGIQSILIFVKEKENNKDNTGEYAADPNGLMQLSIRHIKKSHPHFLLMTDVALDPYSSFGHDGIVIDGKIINDLTVNALVKMALSHIKAGADWVAPSDMMDGRVAAIRSAFNDSGYHSAGILAYSAKYASSLYGPFRDALDSAPGFGDKKTYQMDPRNGSEGVKEALFDESEGADILMVKPGIFYLDVVQDISKVCTRPIAVYQVSGEYSMIKAASEKGWINEHEAMMESLISFKRAGASIIITYFAKKASQHLIDNYPKI
ncbi:MAG: Delta-aminolevulinic acid dehydratase [Owenweeksia sp. TMED14]|nr:MAG: Delta-aminolevulinic acid dehydratase [Owenweeksia sp. TMED14]|tara:strand:+ start:441 stop:1439 length:999 start_codon:yes stop_codon:yes gene_type:complete